MSWTPRCTLYISIYVTQQAWQEANTTATRVTKKASRSEAIAMAQSRGLFEAEALPVRHSPFAISLVRQVDAPAAKLA